jgi:PAS domain S-box-containing protein
MTHALLTFPLEKSIVTIDAEGILDAMAAAMDGMAILDSTGVYVYLNLAHTLMYGYEAPAQLIGKPWTTLYDGDEQKRFENDIMPLFYQTGSWRGEAVGRRRDDTRFPQEVSLGLMADGGIVCVVRDISDRKLIEEEVRCMNEGLERRAVELTIANQELESFSYSLSHDMRNYLSRISLAVQTLEDEYAPGMDPAALLLVKMIHEAEEGMEGLIRAILELFQATHNELDYTSVDLSELARGVALQLAEGDSVRMCSVTIQPGMKCDGDRCMLRVLLENLLGNAWKYTLRTEEARIEFGRIVSGDRQVYFVRDNGIGFPMQDASKLFTPFRRLHSGPDFPGTGIGLATVKHIILRHKGEVWGEGQPGRGATFYFTLPRERLT